MKLKEYIIPVWDHRVYVARNCSRETFINFINKEFHANYSVSKTTATASTFTSRDGVILIWLSKKCPLADIAHECFHAAYSILSMKGITLDTSSEESFAYLIGYLFNLITK